MSKSEQELINRITQQQIIINKLNQKLHNIETNLDSLINNHETPLLIGYKIMKVLDDS